MDKELAGKTSTEIRQILKKKFYHKKSLSYAEVRRELYKFDNGHLYTEHPDHLNCEHIVPQSLFHKKYPMVSDLHHLYACGNNSNYWRGNLKFK